MGTTNALNINNDGIPNFNSTTGIFTSTALTTKGDLLGFTGSVYQRFGVGANGYVLEADSTQPTGWKWTCPRYEFIQHQTASNSASINFTNFQDSACFNGYKLVWTNVSHTGGADIPAIRFSVNNGATWLNSGYKYLRETTREDLSYTISSDATATEIQIASFLGTPPGLSWRQGELFFCSSDDPTTSLNQGVVFTNTVFSQGNTFGSSHGFGLNTTTSQINGIQYFITTANMATGEFYLYGMLK